MNHLDPLVRTLLADCEHKNNGNAHEYVIDPARHPVAFDSNGADVYVVSDLHIGSGKQRDGTYAGTENFYSDGSFLRFVRHLMKRDNADRKPPATLVINGDMIDFLRIVRYPITQDEFIAWQDILTQIGIDMDIEDLKDSVTNHEREYGLQTHNFKSVWKLSASAVGHPEVFTAVAEWIGAGNRVILTKGNHDLEFYWKAVRDYMRLLLAERLVASGRVSTVVEALRDHVLPGLWFVDHSLLIDGTMYIEHGHRFDKFSHVLGPAVLKNTNELNIPFGSFFNRYLANRIELAFPFIDNVRPRESLLPLLFRERFFLGLRVLFEHVPFMLRMIPKKYFRYMLQRVFWYVVFIGIPVGAALWHLWNVLSPSIPPLNALPASGSPIIEFILNKSRGVFESFALSGLSFFAARLISFFQLAEPDSLDDPGRDILREHPEYDIVTMGHTHYPDQVIFDGRWFFNTGTWIPMVELSSAAIRDDRTYTFLQAMHTEHGTFITPGLQRWNDNADRVEPVLIVRPKGS